MDARTRIITATVDCLGRLGLGRTSISAVAQRARVSRPTVYAYFGSRDELISEAIETVCVEIIRRVVSAADDAPGAADYVVGCTVALLRELRGNPIVSLVTEVNDTGRMFLQDALAPHNVQLAEEFLQPLTRYQPDLEPDLPEITETMIRWFLALLLVDSATSTDDEALRGYLHRRLVPALGIRVADHGDRSW